LPSTAADAAGLTALQQMHATSYRGTSMKIRWVNTVIHPLPGAARWIVALCRYPALILLGAAVPASMGIVFLLWRSEVEAGTRTSLLARFYRGLWDRLGSWGVAAFFFLIAAGLLYGFWFYALSRPRTPVAPDDHRASK
jgi:hypothetical protein